MNSVNKPGEDILKRYLNPQSIEKTSEGFTSGLMTRISLETEAAKTMSKRRNLIPLISAIVTLGLTIVAFLIPASNGSKTPGPVSEFLRNIEIPLLPSLAEADILPALDFPAWTTYLVLGIVMIGFLDLFLLKIFHRDHK
jgi:hypothetical protein